MGHRAFGLALAVCALCGILVIAGCQRESADAPVPPDPALPSAPAGEPVAAVEPPSAPPSPPAEPPAEPPGIILEDTLNAYVTATTSVKLAPSDENKVPSADDPGRMVSNWVATLQRGETVNVLEQRPAWWRVTISDGAEGWMPAASLLPSAGVEEATLVAPARVFSRPDVVALKAGRKLETGMLLYILQRKGNFAEVNHGDQTQRVWLRLSDLVTDPQEIALARLLGTIRWMESRKKTVEVEAMIDLARSSYGETRLFAATLGTLQPKATE